MSVRSEQSRNAMKPTGWVLFWRTFMPYQLWRFVIVNIRMMVMIWKSHG